MPTFKDVLLSNPRGWMNEPPPSLYQGDIISSNSPEADYYGERFGPMAGVLAQKLFNARDVAKDVALGLTGIGPAAQAGETIATAQDEGDPIKAAGGFGQLGLAALPFTGKVGQAALATAPRMAALLAGAGLVPAAASGVLSPSQAVADEASPVQQLYSQRQMLNQRLQEAVARRDANRPMSRAPRAGRDPKFTAADQEVKAIESQLAGIDGMIAQENKKNSPEEALRIQEMARRQDEAAKAEELDKPFQSRHPNVATALAIGAPIVSGVASAFGIGRIANKGKGLMADVLQARKDGDVGKMMERAAALENWRRSAIPKQAATIGVASTFPADARGIGDVVDRYSLPDTSKAQKKAEERLSDPAQYGKDMIPALAQGAIWSGMGAKFAPTAPRGDAKALVDLYSGKDVPTLSSLLKGLADESAALQGPLARYGQARQERINSLSDGLSDSRAQLPLPSSGQGGPGSQHLSPRGPSRDSIWDGNISRWRGPDGRFRGGDGPAND